MKYYFTKHTEVLTLNLDNITNQFLLTTISRDKYNYPSFSGFRLRGNYIAAVVDLEDSLRPGENNIKELIRHQWYSSKNTIVFPLSNYATAIISDGAPGRPSGTPDEKWEEDIEEE